MNNWVADLPTPPKYIQAITETYRRGPATGKKWVRFAVWDVAGNGALVQPIKLTTMTTTSSR